MIIIDSFIFFVHDEAVKTAGHTGTSGFLIDDVAHTLSIAKTSMLAQSGVGSGGGSSVIFLLALFLNILTDYLLYCI